MRFPAGLTLIDVGYAEIKPDRQPLNSTLSHKVTLNVPSESKFVHVAVTSVDMSFGTSSRRVAENVAGIWFEITNPDDSELGRGRYKFDFNAVLQNKPDAGHTGDWCG
ncbi:MAG: hypothetical protein AB1664_17475, partial [Thermodesulfobacteriota bacterium]